MSKHQNPSPNYNKKPKTTLRDATIQDIPRLQRRIKNYTNKFFNSENLELKFKSSIYSLIIERANGQIAAYANFDNSPNISALHKGSWLHWIHYYYGVMDVTYGNTLFMTFLVTNDPYDANLVTDIFKEIYLREPKIAFICTVAPPINSIYEEVLGMKCTQLFSLDATKNRLRQSIFISERYEIIPKMVFRRALVEDNDDLVKIIDEKMKTVRQNLGDYYIAEQVLRCDSSEKIVVAEISQVTIGMVWVNTNIDHKVLADNFEAAAYGYFIQPHTRFSVHVDTTAVTEVVRKLSQVFFDKTHHGLMGEYTTVKKLLEENRISLNNFYIPSSESSEDSEESNDNDNLNLFQKWNQTSAEFQASANYTEELRKTVMMPVTSNMTNAFAIQLFGLSNTIDPRRIFDLIAAAFALYPDKDYCIISMSASEASSDTSNGPLLRHFSRVVPRAGCTVVDCLYVTHRNSFLAEIELSCLTHKDIRDIENMLCMTAFKGKAMYYLADIMQSVHDYLENPHSTCDVLIMRSAHCAVGFALLNQNCIMSELRSNYVLNDEDDPFPDWSAGQLKYLYLHPAFNWEWVHVTREIFRLTGYFSMYYTLLRECSKPILNGMLLNMIPICPKKRTYKTYIKPYALYYQNLKLCHTLSCQIEDRIVIIGFNETAKSFIKTLIFLPNARHIQFLNITVITPTPGVIEADCDVKSFVQQKSMFFQARNQFNADFMRKLELRTWIRFIGAEFNAIKSDMKCILLNNGATIGYDRLYLMCSSSFGPPKPINRVPMNYIDVNCRLDKIIFYHKIQLLKKELKDHILPILVYGNVMTAHSCVSTLIQLGIDATQIHFVIPALRDKHNFPDTIDNDNLIDTITSMEQDAGVKIYKNFNFFDWILCEYSEGDIIKSVIFDSDFKRITLKCLVFISYYPQATPLQIRNILEAQNLKIENNKIIINKMSETNIPNVYACGGICQYQDNLFAKQIEQKYFNESEIGKYLAMNLIKERQTGKRRNILESNFLKPILRQSELIDGLVYGGVRKPGRYVPRDIRKNFKNYGKDLITTDVDGEYCHVCLDQNGFITEITCITRFLDNMEILYRVYGLHETMLNNMKARFDNGEISSLLDYFKQGVFSTIIHDQFKQLKYLIRKNNLECLNNFFKKNEKIDKEKIHQYLKENGMEESILNLFVDFIRKHSESLAPYYAIPEDFLNE